MEDAQNPSKQAQLHRIRSYKKLKLLKIFWKETQNNIHNPLERRDPDRDMVLQPQRPYSQFAQA